MEQLYYTQCPVNYGLETSGGFQRKRSSVGYCSPADLRHLAIQPFLLGTSTLAPPCLRYQNAGALTEIVWITPRTHEYETETGLWGRPGGYFAHALQLDPEEIAALNHWPAGLHGSKLWRGSDPEPTRGRLPDGIHLDSSAFQTPPTFSALAQQARSLSQARLAWLLQALAEVTRQERTLILIGNSTQLANTIKTLTFVFPEPYRPDLTFSTYHDRPEELPGYRIQGTLPNLYNLKKLKALGMVADLTTDTFKSDVLPPFWATSLAGWFCQGQSTEETAWYSINHWAKECMEHVDKSVRWSEPWLEHLIRQGLENLCNARITTSAVSNASSTTPIATSKTFGDSRNQVTEQNARNVADPNAQQSKQGRTTHLRGQPMNEDWYYSSLGERFGPIARKDLEALVVAGNLKPTDLAWKVGWPDWQPLAIVDEIKNIFNNEQNVMVYWYYSKDGRQLGPIPWQHLKCLVICGNLLPSDLVWAEGMDHWRPAGEIIR